MTQTSNRFFDEMAKLMTDAAGAAQGMRADFDAMMRSQAERFLRGMDIPQREEFEAVKAMAEKARAENEALKARIETLETALRVRQGEGQDSPQENKGGEPGLTV
jgi:BMFP domain-containing protein YqiC